MLHDLEEETGELHQEIEDLLRDGVFAVDMFEIEFTILLDVEAFILDFPPQPPALIGKDIHVACSQGEVGQPLVAGGFVGLQFAVKFSLVAFNQIEAMRMIAAIRICQCFCPAIQQFQI